MAKAIEIFSNQFEEYLVVSENSPTGLRWKVDILVGKNKNRYAKRKNDIAGCLNKETNYYQVRLKGKTYRCHRVVIALVKGSCKYEVDHLDGDKLNNRFENLRECSKNDNAKNKLHNTSNFLPYCHVSSKQQRVQVAIVVNAKRTIKTFLYSEYGENGAKLAALEYLKVSLNSFIEYGYTDRQINHVKGEILKYESNN